MTLSINHTLKLSQKQYFPIAAPKTGICLHHTVGGTAESTFSWWNKSTELIGSAYLIDRDGTIYETIDPRYWAWQFGLKWPLEEKTAFEKRFIGIEIASEGGLIEKDGQLYCFDRISDKTLKKRSEAFDYGQDYRGYRYFDRYEPAQLDAVIELLNQLCRNFRIEKKIPQDYLGFYDRKLFNFQGIIGHANVRLDKSDPSPDSEFWERIIKECGLSKTEVLDELEGLFEHNVAQYSQLNRAAAAVVKGLLYELQRDGRNTWIKLFDPDPFGHVIHYKLIQGDPELVKRIAAALGFKAVTDSTLEVYHA